MTLPTRPAPAPPGSRGQFAAANANASLEQLRLQLQQQQQLQRSQQNVIVPKLSVKLPPPPKQPAAAAANSLNNGTLNNNTNSITRKFPQARYAPATNWDDSPFDVLSESSGGGGVGSGRAAAAATFMKPPTQQTNMNGNYKKQPPPRPPPPQVPPKEGFAVMAPKNSSVFLSQIFHLRKKSYKAPKNPPSRAYGSSTYGTTATSKSSTTNSGFLTTTSLSSDWNSAWNTTTNYNAAAQQTAAAAAAAEAQLISFDSPPSSPTFTQKSNSDCLSVDSFSSDSNFSSPNNGSVSQPESGFEDDFSARSRPATTSPLDPWEALDAFGQSETATASTTTATTTLQPRYGSIGTAPVRNLSTINTRIQTNSDNPLCNGKSLLPPAPALNMPTIIKPKVSQKPKAPKPPPQPQTLVAKPATAFGSFSPYSDNLITPPSPPMPQCAPPPPPLTSAITSTSSFPASTQQPSILDVITGKIDAIQLDSVGRLECDRESNAPQPYGVALYDFDSTEEGDLCFRENEKIYLLEQVSADWFKGRTRSGCEGIFPINYIEIKVPLSNNSASSAARHATQLPATSATPTYQTAATSASSDLKVRSLYNFPAEVDGDLELKENDLVTILYRINDDWLYGEVDGRQGQFPANFLEHVPSCIPMP